MSQSEEAGRWDKLARVQSVTELRLAAAERWRSTTMVAIPILMLAVAPFLPVFSVTYTNSYGSSTAQRGFTVLELLDGWDDVVTSQHSTGLGLALALLLFSLLPLLVAIGHLSAPLSPSAEKVNWILGFVVVAAIFFWVIRAGGVVIDVYQGPDGRGSGVAPGVLLIAAAVAWILIATARRATEHGRGLRHTG